jgi:hypothetical protein
MYIHYHLNECGRKKSRLKKNYIWYGESIKYYNIVMTCQVSCDDLTIIVACYCKLTRAFLLFTGTIDGVIVILYPFYDKATSDAISLEDPSS